MEADGYDWLTPAALLADLGANPQRYSAWFRIYLSDHWAEVASLAPDEREPARRS